MRLWTLAGNEIKAKLGDGSRRSVADAGRNPVCKGVQGIHIVSTAELLALHLYV